jgi:preprotein translocase subunit SecD
VRDHTRTRAAGVVVLLIGAALCVGCSADAPNVSLEMRIVQDIPADDMTKMTMKVWNGQRTYYAHNEILLTERDVMGAVVVEQDNGAPAMCLALTEEGQVKLSRVTQHNVGNRLGIIINGRLQCATPINAPIETGVVMVKGLMLERAAKRCSRALTQSTA